MKKIGVILFSLALTLGLLLLGGTAHAEEASVTTGSVIIKEESDGYCLYEYSGGVVGAELYSAESVGELFLPLSYGEYEVTFDRITASENIILPEASFTFVGTLSLSGSITVGEGCELTLCDIDLTFSLGGSLLVKGGSLLFLDGNLYSDGVAISLSNMAKSALLIDGGVIITSSSLPALRIEQGTADLVSGRIENSSGIAVDCTATLNLGSSVSLSGAPYEIITSLPVYLESKGSSFSAGARVQYRGNFKKGTVTPVFYKSSPLSVHGIELYDMYGEGQEITFFDSHSAVNEEKFTAVYKPFNVDFVIDGTSLFTLDYLFGEPLAFPTYDKKVGYNLSSWFYNADMTESAAEGASVCADMTLYAKNILECPTFSLKSATFTYDKSEHLLDFSSLEHPLKDKGFYTYEWINAEGETVAYTRALSLREVKDSGEYKCKVTFTVGRDFATFTTPVVFATVDKCTVPIPECDRVYYNGRAQYSALSSTSLFMASEAYGVDVGLYPVMLSLFDSDNYKWENADGADAFAYFEIMKAENSFTEELTVSDLYFGNKPAPVAISRFGTVKFLYSLDPLGSFDEEVPNKVGVYYVKAVVEGTDNYYALESEPYIFRIKSEELVSLSILTLPNKCEYTAFELFSTDGLTLKAIYTSGREAVLSASEVSVFYQTSDCLRFGDSGVFIEYLGHRLTLPLTVNKKKYDYVLVFEDAELEYNGLYQTLLYDFLPDASLDGIPLAVTITGGGTEVGSYEVTLTFSSASKDYLLPEPITRTVSITQKEVEVVWEKSEFVYNGYIQAPTAYFTDVFGAKRILTVTGGRSGAALNCIATAETADKNYKLVGQTMEFSIKKADFDLSGLYWDMKTIVYNSEEQTVTLLGLPQGLTVLGYVGNSATETGKYKAEVLFGFDSDNYNEPCIEPYEWEIIPALYDMSSITFLPVETVYDGSTHYPLASGCLPIGLDGSVPSYSFSEGVTDAGEKIVKITFFTDSKNYIAPEGQYVTVRVLKKGVYVKWGGCEFTYNGYLQLPEASVSECPIAIYALGVGAGKHTARAVSLSDNFYVINSEVEYTILKANNFWTDTPTVSDVFLTSPVSYEAEAHFGSPEYKIYSDIELKNEVTSIERSGTYYLVLTVAESENYLALTSRPLEFKVLDIVPISLEVVIKNQKYYAFESLTPDDYICTVTNNDGSKFNCTEVTVIYTSGNALCAADSTVSFSCFGLKFEAEISVSKLDYDTSGVTWENTEFVYDGQEKSACLAGLPEGVEVEEYTLKSAVNAGEYPLSAVLTYDSINYNPPIIPSATLVIEKQTVTPRVVYGEEYNGRAQTPLSDNRLYYFVTGDEYINAGSYVVEVVLTDNLNYTLSSNTATFVIPKREITVTLNPLTQYMFEELGKISGEVTSGSILESDGDIIIYRRDGDILTAEVTNPNYNLTVVEARIDRVNKPSAGGLDFIFTITLLLLLIILAAAALIVRYRRKPGVATNKGALALLPAPEESSLTECDVQHSTSVTLERAEEMITDTIAKTLIRKRDMSVTTSGRRKGIINLDTVSDNFMPEERVDINLLKEKGLVSKDVYYIKVLGRGSINKPLKVYANSFSLGAVKMLALTGGEANRVHSAKRED